MIRDDRVSVSGIVSNFKLQIDFSQYLQECVWPGLGLFGEAYLLFSMGTLKPLWEELYPRCIGGYTCPHTLLFQLSFSVIAGVCSGMLLLGYTSSFLGRRTGSILTASLMCGGSLCMLILSVFLTDYPLVLFRCMIVVLFVFGIGVGGEYPLSASSASERAMEDRNKRREELYELDEQDNDGTTHQNGFSGGRVLLVFSMQGMGIFIQSLILVVLLACTRLLDANSNPYYYSTGSLLMVWRLVYLVGAAVLVLVFRYRFHHLRESTVWEEDSHQREEMRRLRTVQEHGDFVPPTELMGDSYNDTEDKVTLEQDDSHTNEVDPGQSATLWHNKDKRRPEVRLLLQHYGHRLLGTSLTWLLWDVAFYGNKLYQSTFLLSLGNGRMTLLQVSAMAMGNAFIALLGYFAAAAVVDNPRIGRLKLQMYGFVITGSLFCLCGELRQFLSASWLVPVYFASSFFGQFGPNATTFLIPAEIFPTEGRTFCHGVSASAGKLGALIAVGVFNYATESGMFFICGWCCIAAFAVTYVTIPDVTTMDLFEIDKQWRMTLDGEKEEYVGSATDPKYLSYWEKHNM